MSHLLEGLCRWTPGWLQLPGMLAHVWCLLWGGTGESEFIMILGDIDVYSFLFSEPESLTGEAQVGLELSCG